MSTETRSERRSLGGAARSRTDLDARSLRSRPRRAGLLAFAALMIVGSGLAGAVLFSAAGDRLDVLAVRDDITRGHVIERSDLVQKSVAGVDDTILASEVDAVVGSTATVDMVAGQVLTSPMLTSSPTPGPSQAAVGLSLEPSRAPAAGLVPGDLVDVIAVLPIDNASGAGASLLDAPTVLAAGVTVFDVAGSATDGATVLVTVIVEKSDASRIAAYSTAGRVAVVEVGPGQG